MSARPTFDLSAAIELFNNVTTETLVHIDYVVGKFHDYSPQCFLHFRKKHWIISAECWLAAIAHHYHTHCNKHDRQMWLQALSDAEFCTTFSRHAFEVWHRFQQFIQCYEPWAVDAIDGTITMRDLLQSRIYTAYDVQLLRLVGLVDPNTVDRVKQVQPYDQFLWRETSEAGTLLRSSMFALGLRHYLQPCLTEWRRFDNFLHLDVPNALTYGGYNDEAKIENRIVAVDVRVRRLCGTLSATLQQYFFEFAQFSVDGSLNLFLLQLHARSLRRKLHQRARQLFVLLIHKLRCNLVAHRIVSATMCLEHRYATAILCDGAPCAFREFISDHQLSILVPLMMPSMMMPSSFQSYDAVASRQSDRQRCDDFDAYIDPKTIAYRRWIVLPGRQNGYDEDVALLHFDPLVTQIAAFAGDVRVVLSSPRAFSCISSLLFSLPCSVSFDSVELHFKDRFRRRNSWTASEAFIARCADRDWYALSLKSLTSHRDAIVYNCETTPSMDPLCRVGSISDIEIYFRNTSVDEFSDGLRSYGRFFNYWIYRSSLGGLLYGR